MNIQLHIPSGQWSLSFQSKSYHLRCMMHWTSSWIFVIQNRYQCGLMLRTLCDEAVKLKSHPDHSQKVDMAQSINMNTTWDFPTTGSGFDTCTALILGTSNMLTSTTNMIFNFRTGSKFTSSAVSISQTATLPTISTNLTCEQWTTGSSFDS